MPVRSSGLLYALSRTLLTMFEKPPSNLRQLPRDAIVAMFERAVRCYGASLVDNEPIVQYSREFVSACAVGWERRVSGQCRLILMERHLPAPPDLPCFHGQDKSLVVNRRQPVEVGPLVSVVIELTLVVVWSTSEVGDPAHRTIVVVRDRMNRLELFGIVQFKSSGAYNVLAQRSGRASRAPIRCSLMLASRLKPRIRLREPRVKFTL